MKLSTIFLAGLLASATISCASTTPTPAQAAERCGSASWYALHGNKTASGERMNKNAATAAHRSLKFGTKLKVTNQRNGRSVVVRINDRGPFIGGRVLDLSKGSANQIGIVQTGVGRVCYQVVSK